jgi:hypothetical protein
MSFGNKRLDEAYDKWVTRSPYEDEDDEDSEEESEKDSDEEFKCEGCGKLIKNRYEGVAWCSECYKAVLQRRYNDDNNHSEDD